MAAGMPNGAAVVKIGGASAVYKPSTVFHQDAFAFATADLIMPKGVDFSARRVLDGIGLRIVRAYDINNDAAVPYRRAVRLQDHPRAAGVPRPVQPSALRRWPSSALEPASSPGELQHERIPKMLYGPKGWGDLTDCQMVNDAAEEKAARKKGYADLGPLPSADESEAA